MKKRKFSYTQTPDAGSAKKSSIKRLENTAPYIHFVNFINSVLMILPIVDLHSLFGFRFLQNVMIASKKFFDYFNDQFSKHAMFYLPVSNTGGTKYFILTHVTLINSCENEGDIPRFPKNYSKMSLPEGIETLHYPLDMSGVPFDKTPSTIKTISFPYQILAPLSELPNLRHIIFCYGFTKAIARRQIPNWVERVTLVGNFNQRIDNVFPDSVTYLRFGKSFNQHIYALPSKLETLILSNQYKKKVHNLPVTLRRYDVPITEEKFFDKEYCHNITRLKVLNNDEPCDFDDGDFQKFSAITRLTLYANNVNCEKFPPHLETLKILANIWVGSFPKIPDSVVKIAFLIHKSEYSLKTLPSTLKYLTMSKSVDKTGSLKFPPTLVLINLVECDFFDLSRLPPSLESFNLNIIPFKTRHLQTKVAGQFTLLQNLRTIKMDFPITANIHGFPLSIESLSMYSPEGGWVRQCLPNLKNLYFDKFMNIENYPFVEKIIFHFDYNLPPVNLPQTLRYIQFGQSFNQPVDNLPPNTLILTFGDSFNREVNNLPQSVKRIYFGKYFNRPLRNLPKKVTHIVLNSFFRQPLSSKGDLPEGLKYLLIYETAYRHKIYYPPYIREAHIDYDILTPLPENFLIKRKSKK